VDREIDLMAVSDDNIPNIETEALTVMKPSTAAEQEQHQWEGNAKKAKEAVDKLFPNEKWKTVEEGIYLSPRRKIGRDSNYEDEKRDAQILRDMGSTVYLTPESRSVPGKKYDAIVNGLRFEFKNVGGNESTLETQFLRSREQAPNVFINLETSDLTRRQIMSTLYGARNRPTTSERKGYADYNQFAGGRIILKIKGQKNLAYLNVNDLKFDKH
jgi:hypothetical protein